MGISRDSSDSDIGVKSGSVLHMLAGKVPL